MISQDFTTAGSENSFTIIKKKCRVHVEASTAFVIPVGKEEERIFNLVPGFEAVPLLIGLSTEGSAKLEIKVQDKL